MNAKSHHARARSGNALRRSDAGDGFGVSSATPAGFCAARPVTSLKASRGEMIRRCFIIALGLPWFCQAIEPANAGTIPSTDPLVPAGLSVGDSFQLVIVTSTTRSGDSAVIADYNSFVTSAASVGTSVGHLGATWYAIASTQGSPNGTSRTDPAYIAPAAAIENAVVSAAVYLPDGTKIADDFTDMWDGSIDAPINVDENGNVVAAGTRVWTGSREQFSGQWGYPGAWPNGSGGSAETTGFYWNSLGDRAPGFYRYTEVGQTGQTTAGSWLTLGEQQGGNLRFYAVSEPLAVTVPEPAALCLAAISVVGLMWGRRR